MGYQESIITTANKKDFPKLIARVNQLGKDYYEDRWCNITSIVTLKKRMYLDEFDSYPKGTKFLYAVGDRTCLYGPENFVNIYRPEQQISKYGRRGGWDGEKISFEELGFYPVVICCEYLPRDFYDEEDKIYDGMETSLVKVEEFVFDEDKNKGESEFETDLKQKNEDVLAKQRAG